jgi:hypothetical protein
MTRVINIETCKYHYPLGKSKGRMLHFLVILTVFAGMCSCGIPQVAVSSISIDLNNYQTAHILKPGIAAIQFNALTVAPSLTGTQSIKGANFLHNTAYSGGMVFETAIAEEWQVGIGWQFGLSPKIEDWGLNGNIGTNAFAKVAIGNNGETIAPVRFALLADFSYQLGDKSTGQNIRTTYFDSSASTRTAFGATSIGATLPDSIVQWGITSKAYRFGLALPITVQSQNSNVCLTFRPAIHYFNYSLSGQETSSRKRTMYEAINPINMRRNYFIPSLSIGYGIQDKDTGVDWLTFELTYALWDNTHTLSAGYIFRIPIRF